MAAQPRGVRPYLFLSYASSDRAKALSFDDTLEAAGIHVWIDRTSIVGGSSWTAEIVRGIQGCAALALLCSQAAVGSPDVQRELNLAVEHDRSLEPLLLEPVALPVEVQYALAGRQRIELLDRPQGDCCRRCWRRSPVSAFTLPTGCRLVRHRSRLPWNLLPRHP